MAGAHLARILSVVVEIFRLQETVLVTNETIGGDALGIELDLDLDVFGDRDQRPASFLDQHLARFLNRIDVGVIPITVIGDLLHRRVLEISRTETQDREKDTALTLGFDQAYQGPLARNPDIEVTVGRQYHPVRSTLDEVPGRHIVGELDSGAARGRAARFQALDSRVQNAPLVPRC